MPEEKSEKTLGRIAYETYCKSMNWVPIWEHERDLIRQAWEDAAAAVAVFEEG
jgi:hypothetical protein